MNTKDRLSDLIAGKNVDCCFKCRHFEKTSDPLDTTKSFGDCKFMLENYPEDYDGGIFGYEYCDDFSPCNPYDENQTFYIALFKDKTFHYIHNIKPNDFQRLPYGKRENEVVLFFDIPKLDLSDIQSSTYFIDNKLPNEIYGCSYIISTEDNELELKDTLVKYILHRLQNNIRNLEDEIKETKSDYSYYSKFLKERNF